MTINTEITQKDWKAFGRFLIRRSRKRWTPGYYLICFGLVIATGLFLSTPGTDLASFFAGGAAGLIWLISASITRQLGPTEDGTVLGPKQIEVTEEGIRWIGKYHESAFSWEAVRAVEVTDKHVFVLLERISGIIVPRRSFTSDAEREEFVSEVRRRMRGLPI